MNDGHINASMDINNASLDVTFGEVYEIDKGMPAAIIANLYSSQSTYSPDDYVIYRNKLYKCLVAIETPEEFDTEKWELVKVAEELKEKADKSTTYTKTETDALLDEKANANNVYTKAESDTLLDEKADRQSTLAALSSLSDAINTKADAAGTTAALALKADKTYVDTELNKKADKSSTYTKTEVDTALASKAAADSVYTKVETDNLVKNSNLVITEEFSDHKSYSNGSIVIYEGELYVYWGPHFEGPFDPEAWTKYTVDELVQREDYVLRELINNKMDKSNPTGTGALSINRKANTTVGEESVAIGYNSTASGEQSIAGGYNATASNTISVALGNAANASGFAATAFGTSTRATGNYSQAEGYQTRAGGGSSHAEGNQSYASGGVSHAEGYSTQAQGQYSHAEGNTSIASGSTSHAEGYGTTASGDYSHAEGRESIASAYSCHAEGIHTQATQNYSHSEGCRTTASGNTSHAEGDSTIASGNTSHAEGYETTASGTYSHAEGYSTTANGYISHAEGGYTVASGDNSHAEGDSTIASGNYSHSEGFRTTANHKSQHVFGEYNIEDNSENEQYDRGNYVEIVGNGYWDSEEEEAVCSNARTLDWSGNEVLAGDLTYNGNKSLTNEISRLDGKIDALPEPMIFKGTLGTNGTINALPTASASNEGWTFKCITAGTYAGLTLKIGDTVTCFNPPNTSVYEWDISGYGDTDTDTWRAIKVNGTEKLANGISSGDVDFVNTDNIEVTFDTTGNKVKIATKNIYTQTQVDTALSNKLDKSNPTGTGSLSLNRKSGTDIGTNSVAVGNNTTASGEYSFAEGTNTVASSYNAHAEGNGTSAEDTAAHAEGIDTTASYAAHAEGESTVASGDSSHAEGHSTTARGNYSHAEGEDTTASGYTSHAEGKNTTSSEEATHAEGTSTTASADAAHAEGYNTTASGYYSHAQNFGTVATRRSQNVFGEYNIAESGTAYSRGNYVEIVGNGENDNSRSNARTLDWSGNEMIAGDLTFNGSTSLTTSLGTKANSSDVYTKQQTDTKLSTLRGNIASDYSSSQIYDVGDCVIYNEVLYQCNTAITVAEEWTPAHWTQVKATEIGGGSGSSTLGGLTDVTISSVTDGQVLKYDSTNQKWVNGTGGSGASTLADLTDTVINNPTNNQMLIYDGTNHVWRNVVPQYGYNISGILEAGQTSITFTNANILSDSYIQVFTPDGTEFNSITATTGSVTITFDAQPSDLSVCVRLT